jgi:hypothetical protein
VIYPTSGHCAVLFTYFVLHFPRFKEKHYGSSGAMSRLSSSLVFKLVQVCTFVLAKLHPLVLQLLKVVLTSWFSDEG